MPTTAAKSTGITSKLIVPLEAFQALQQLARSKRLAVQPSLMLEYTLENNGIFYAGLIPSIDYEHVKTLYIPTQTFERLKFVQSKLNIKPNNFTVMDIIVANLIIIRRLHINGELIGIVQNKGISPANYGDVLEHYDLQSDTVDWLPITA